MLQETKKEQKRNLRKYSKLKTRFFLFNNIVNLLRCAWGFLGTWKIDIREFR